jgi:molybdate transport system substrate-binding protein
MSDKVKVVETLPSPIPVLYPIALVKRAGASPQAADFLSYVVSPEGRAVLARYGFSEP